MSRVDTVHSWTQLALGPGGRSLIEASAGTGKTWTISVLYLRLLLERELSPGADRRHDVHRCRGAGTARARARAHRLGPARSRGGDCWRPLAGADDRDDRHWLHARWRDGDDDGFVAARAHADLKRLRLAQTELDRAPMGTLHSLCRRILADNPFESGSTFELGRAVTPDAINAELIDDLWRQLSQSEGVADADDEIWRKAGRAPLEKYLRTRARSRRRRRDDRGRADRRGHAHRERADAGRLGQATASQFARSNDKLRARLTELAQVHCGWRSQREVADDLSSAR